MHKNPKLHLLTLKNHDIQDQLLLEEALLRKTDKNWCILNHGSPPRIVMGISGKPHDLINMSKIVEDPIPLIKRYSFVCQELMKFWDLGLFPKKDVKRFFSAHQPYIANPPSSASISRRRLYLAILSLRQAEPVLICPPPMATAKSAMKVSSVSPLRWEMT